MVGRDLGPDRQKPVLLDAELGELQLGLDVGNGEPAALRFRDVLHFGMPDTELHRSVAVHVHRPVSNDLAAIHLQNRHGDVLTGVLEHPCHPDLLCNYA